MNKIINFGAMLTIAVGAVTFNSSCSSNDDLGKFETIKQQEFKKFVVPLHRNSEMRRKKLLQ